jgi:hypothetical protein
MRFDSSTRLRTPTASPAKGARSGSSSGLHSIKNDKEKMSLQRVSSLCGSTTPVFTFNQTIVLALFCSLVAVAGTTAVLLIWPLPMPAASTSSRALHWPLMEEPKIPTTTTSTATTPSIEKFFHVDDDATIDMTNDEVVAVGVDRRRETKDVAAAIAHHDTPVLSRFPMSVLPPPTVNKDGPRPKIAWLLSFPNRYSVVGGPSLTATSSITACCISLFFFLDFSRRFTLSLSSPFLLPHNNCSGTSFTLHMTREASNCTTGTNYALEGDIKDKPSVQAIPGSIGANGPFLEVRTCRGVTVSPPCVVCRSSHLSCLYR